MQEAERIARGHGCQVYEGRCFDGNLAPFQPFVEIIRQLIAELRLQERREAAPADVDLTATHAAGLPVESLARLLAIVNDYSGELLRIAPELRKYLPGRGVPAGRFRPRGRLHLPRPVGLLRRAGDPAAGLPELRGPAMGRQELARPAAAPRRGPGRGPAVRLGRLDRRAAADDRRLGPHRLRRSSRPCSPSSANASRSWSCDLSPLAEGETRELIALRLNCRPEELSDDLVARVHELCGGNPFFVSETVREWFEKDAIARSDSGWVLATEAADASDLPETVREAMRLRLQGLPAKAQEVLGAAAVIGAVVDIDLLREVLPDLTESDVLDAIDALLPRRVFRETGNAGRVQFVHDLLRELSYGDLSATRRRSLHRRVGELLERRREQGQAVAAAVLADHFKNAEDRPRAFAYSMEAAEAALNAYAFNNAITHLNDALELLPDGCPGRDEVPPLGHARQGARVLGPARRGDRGLWPVPRATPRDWLARANGEEGIGEAYHRKGDSTTRSVTSTWPCARSGYPRPPSLPGMYPGHGEDRRVLPHAPILVAPPGSQARPHQEGRDRPHQLRTAGPRLRGPEPHPIHVLLVQAGRLRQALGEARARRPGLFQVRI